MNYFQSLNYLNSFLNLEKLSQFPKNAFFNLQRMAHLLRSAGHPEKHFFPILIAGTTGKGSTGFFLESILKANGIRAGYYHSPHVEDSLERIRLQGDVVSPKLWAEGLSAIRRLLKNNPLPEKLGILTYFEILTFLAVFIFAREKVRIGIFEIGLGGRLDATNILKAPLVLLTPIHLDHEAFLGSTIRKIASEKAGIIKLRNHVVVGNQTQEALSVIRAQVRKNKGKLWQTRPMQDISLGLSGDFQKQNAGMAVQAARILHQHFKFFMCEKLSKKGLRYSNWKGRMEFFRRYGHTWILDGAHNPISVSELVKSLKQNKNCGPFHAPGVCHGQRKNKRPVCVGGRKTWLIFGAMADKNSRKMLEISSRYFSKIILVRIPHDRAKTPGMLAEEAKDFFNVMLVAETMKEAIRVFRAVSDSDTTAVVTGSFYLVGEARKILA